MPSGFCTHCGHDLPPLARFCTDCGTAVPAQPGTARANGFPTATPTAPEPGVQVRPVGPDELPTAHDATLWHPHALGAAPVAGSSLVPPPPYPPAPAPEPAPAFPPATEPAPTQAWPGQHPTPPAPPRRPRRRGLARWWPWLVVWFLAAVVVVMGGLYLGGVEDDREPGTGGSPDRAASSGPGSGTTGTAVNTVVEAPATAAPNADVRGEPVSYEAEHMLDQDPHTAWRMNGDGTGRTLTFTFDEPTHLSSVGLVNGYAKADGATDWYPRNRRILQVRWLFDDGTAVDQELREITALQTVGVDVTTSRVRLVLEEVTDPGAENGRNFTAISDVRFTESD